MTPRLWCRLMPLLAILPFAGAAVPLLPPVDGAFSGVVTPLGAGSGLELKWTVSAATPSAQRRTVHLQVSGPGTELDARGRIRLPEGLGRWELSTGEADVRTWWTALAPRFPGLSGIEASGRVTLSGGGALRLADGAVTGELRAALHHAAAENAGKTWSVNGIEAVVIWPHLPDLATEVQQRVTFAAGAIGSLELRNGFAEFELLSASRLHVRSARVEALGGVVRCGDFDLDLNRPELRVAVTVEGLDLRALRGYLPSAVADAQGRLDGKLTLHWSRERGFALGNGELTLRRDQPASLRLSPQPGFLSSHVPARFDLAPAWMGAIGRLFSQPNPALKTLESIELGQEKLVVDSVDARLTPDNAGAGSTATVKIVAHPTNAKTVKVVRLTVVVDGPLADVLRFGMDGRVSLGR